MLIGLDNITQQIIQRKSLHILMDLEQAGGIGRRLLAAGNYLLDGVYQSHQMVSRQPMEPPASALPISRQHHRHLLSTPRL